MKSLARFAVVLVASLIGCSPETFESEGELLGEDTVEPSEEDVGSARQAVTLTCDPFDPATPYCNGDLDWRNGDLDWRNGDLDWRNGNGSWLDGNQGWSHGTNGFSEAWTNEWTTGYANAWSNAWGGSWDNGWSYASMPAFAWTEPQVCAHPLSQVGPKLTNGCNPMVALVCSKDSYCCHSSWDSICVNEATSWAGRKGTYEGCYSDSSTRALPNYLGIGMTVAQCTFEAQARGFTYAGLQWGGECYAGNTLGYSLVSDSECNMPCSADPMETCGGSWRNSVWRVPATHPVTMEGVSLTSNHSVCAAAVIAQDSFCGQQAWDIYCVEEAAQLCVERYVTRPRLDLGELGSDDNRVMVDTCIETKLPGYPACPFGLTGKECCRRGLVLKGVYKRDTYVPGYGRPIKWTKTAGASTALGAGQTIKATVVADPCVKDFRGNVVCDDMHHLWQGAGPDGSIYPDCSGTTGARPCNNTIFPDQMREVELLDIDAPYRGILVAAMSALITTNDHYIIDIRSTLGDTESLPPHNLQAETFEAYWTWSGNGFVYTGGPVCTHPNAPQRTGTDPSLVSNLPTCYPWGDAPHDYIETIWPSAD
jgi:hypothetical protein